MAVAALLPLKGAHIVGGAALPYFSRFEPLARALSPLYQP